MKQVPEIYKPVMSLVVYQSSNEAYNSSVYVEEHTIRELKENQFTFGPAKPCRTKLLGKLLNSIRGIDAAKYYFTEIIPENVLSFNIKDQELNLIWKVKRHYHELNFDKSHNISSSYVMNPNLIFKIKGNTLYVFAIKNYKCNMKSLLYHAPYHNIYNDGRVCMGNAEIKWHLSDLTLLINNIEEVFFSSKFTHLNHKEFKKNINVIWDKGGFLNNEDLTKNNKTIKSII